MCHYSKHDLSTNRQINWSNEVKDALAIRRLVYSPSVCFPSFCCVSPPQSLSLYPSCLLFFFSLSLSHLRRMSNVLKIAGVFWVTTRPEVSTGALPLLSRDLHPFLLSFDLPIVCLHLQQAHASLLNHSHNKQSLFS